MKSSMSNGEIRPLCALGILLRVKGDGKRYKCGLRAAQPPGNRVYHQASFESLSGQWQVVKLHFNDFVPTFHGRRLSEDKRLKREDLSSVNFLISDKQKGSFQLEIDWVRAWN